MSDNEKTLNKYVSLISVPANIEIKDFKGKVKVNEQIRFEAFISGEPAPEVSWAFNGKPINGPPCTAVKKGLCRAEFVKNQVGLHDAGIYQITASSKCGTVTAEANLVIVCEYHSSFFRSMIFCDQATRST